MPRRMIILTGQREAGPLTAFVRARAPQVLVAAATDKATLMAQCLGDLRGVRLISFLSGVIVPAALLDRLALTAYNIHPGSPDFPGLCPEAFALAAGADAFGATAHEMLAAVDAGTIVDVARFPVPPGTDRLALAAMAYSAAVELFRRTALHCLASDAALAPLPNQRWAGPAKRQAEYRALLARHPELRLDADRGLRCQAVGL
ncbi:MAG: hypothetical protein Tsb0016_06720 [Sphingomonadales bacterium]